jgi:hypothetical protein
MSASTCTLPNAPLPREVPESWEDKEVEPLSWWNTEFGTETNRQITATDFQLPVFPPDEEDNVSPRLGDPAAAHFFRKADEARRERNAKQRARKAAAAKVKAANLANPVIRDDEARLAALAQRRDHVLNLLEGPEVGINPKYLSPVDHNLGGYRSQAF